MYRFTMPGFLSTFALAHLVGPDGTVLCFACGTGHEPFLISRMWPNAKIVCADYSFCSLYLSKKYFAPGASYVCLDGDYLLPFESGQFSTIFSSDTLPVLDSKLSLAQEFRRVGDDRAVTLLPHMHNRLVSPYAKSLTPHGYRQLFRDVEARILPDENVVRDYFFNDVLDLTRDWPDDELAASEQHLSIIACKDTSFFVKRENLWERRILSICHPCVNPAYRILGQPGNWELKRQAGDYYLKTIIGTDKACLPDSCRVTARSVDTLGLVELQRTDSSQFDRLVKSLVILDLPESFVKQRQGLKHGTGLLPAHQKAASIASIFKNMTIPQVSVIIPTCNRPKLLPTAIRSVLGQSFRDFEVVIVDDASDDSIDSVVNDFQDERVRWIRHQSRRGAAAARNTGIQNTCGEFVAFLDDDDEWYPEKLAPSSVSPVTRSSRHRCGLHRL